MLASYNPETSTTARKATGSYYTPRKIVDYMVDESLKAYLKNKLPEDAKIDDKLNNLFSYSEESHKFNNSEVDALIKAINILKVIDPAVGSGAFPMGVLQKLVFVLSKLDPHNKKWKQEQIDAVENNVSDDLLKKELIKKIESNFKNNELDYGRKLYLIQNCIYGVDIQITAIQISKLRFFISLLVDEKSDKNKENFGIEPLPNLETKFVAANSLIGLQNNGQAMLPDPRILELEKELKKIRAKHFNANHKSEKEWLRKKDKEIRLQLEKLFKQSGFPSDNTEKIINWDPYSPNTSADFFDSEWMFGVEGFDVVIGNPPYIKEYTKKSAFDNLHSSDYYQGKMDLWYFFGAMGLDLLRDGGIETYIAPNNWTTNAGASKFRNKIIDDSIILAFLDFGNYKVFESAGIQTMVYVLKKNSEIENYSVKCGKLLNDKADKKLLEEFINSDFDVKNNNFVKPVIKFDKNKFKDKNIIFLDNDLSEVFKKIKEQADFYLAEKEVAQGIVFPQDFLNKKNQQILGNSYKTGDGIFVLSEAEKNKLNLSEKELELIKPYYTTKQIHKWQCDLKNKEWIIYTDSKFKNPENIKPYPNIKKHLDKFQKIITSSNKPYGLHRARDEKFFKGEKIIIARKCLEPQFCYTDFDCYVSATFYVIKTKRVDLKYLTALLNSKFIKFWLKNQGKMQGVNYQIDKEPLLNLPLKMIDAKQQKSFINLVDQI
ncbi:Eco57I restriction-modification methylase domain-containing protein, partial [Patescibacteria group bacterium]|nr:Eco57I restriction-modification methylase domain-containing protein [Patescibacteria group bacterium]